jgi:ATP-dependent RNA helicase DDX24/MAK5
MSVYPIMSLKRKLPSSSSSRSKLPKSSAVKKSRIRLPTNDLKWRKVETAREAFAGMDEGGGMMMLEELDDVDVEWEEDGRGGKVARFVVCYLMVYHYYR